MTGYNLWLVLDGVLVLAVLIVLGVVAVADWRAHRKAERVFRERMRRVEWRVREHTHSLPSFERRR